ncbi:MAG: glutathione S-transferase N-terminal domain-containing protein, partial [Clostridiales bacterium]|nr:glutathione S-transferase N-terminal domain-containing protein [Clostridiales bacterium]
ERLVIYQEQYGDLYNLEATPAESTTYRLAKHDKERYPNIITANENGTPYYTNSSHLPVGYTEDVFSALDIQDELQTLYTSGTVFHTFLGEKLPDWKAAAKLVRTVAENYRLPYFTLSPTYSVCRDHGYIAGEVYTCPKCGKKTEVNSRITGYYRPVQNWNDGKAQEFKDRKVYDTLKYQTPHPSHVVDHGCACNDIPHVTGEKHFSLFTTPTCPNCKVAIPMLKEAGLDVDVINAVQDPDSANKYGVKQAPTLIVSNGDAFDKYAGIAAIKKYLDENPHA